MDIAAQVKGTVYQCTGTIGGGGVFGNHYEQVAASVTFEEWLATRTKESPEMLPVLGESWWCMEVQTHRSDGKFVTQPFMCFHGKFYFIMANHEHWGLFIPDGVSPKCVEPALVWLRRYGDRPQIEGAPDTYHYEPIIIGATVMDGQRLVRNE